MKKILSLLLVALMIVGMLPIGAIHSHAAEVSATITFDDTAKRTVGTTSQQVWEENGITFTNDKASSSSNVNTSYYNPIRLYAKSSATIAYSGTITKIEVTCSSDSYATAFATSVGSEEATASGTVVTIVPTVASSSYRIDSFSAQTRVSSVTVYATVSDEACAHANTSTVEATSADCTNAGYTEGVYCNDCFTYISGHEVISALGHTESSVVTAPTCTADGYTTYTCSVCGNERKADYVDATGHTMANGVCSVCGVEQLNTQKAAAIAVGDQVIFVCESASMEMNGFYSTSYAYGTSYTDAPLGVNVWTVVAGAADGTYAFVMDGAYLCWTSGNSAKTSDTLDANSFWNVTFDDEGNALITNAADSTRKLQWNATNPRFAAYTSTQTAIQLYTVIADGEGEEPACEHTNTTTNTVAATCTEAGSKTVVCNDCGVTVSTSEIAALGHSYVDNICSVCGAEFEGEVDTTDPTEPTEPDVTEPASSSATITFDDEAKRTTLTTEQQVWEENGITVTNNKASSTTNVADYEKPARFYKSSELIVTYTGMTKIEVTCNTAEYATALKNSISDDNIAVTVSDKVVTIVPAGAVDSFTIASMSAQVRVDSITVYAEVSDHEHTWSEWVETTAPTCTETGIETSTCTICGEIKTQTVAATGHTYTYVDGSMTCTCGDVAAFSTIAEAKAYTSKTQLYYIKGIVTYVNGKNVYIEDATGGICVYFAAAPSDIALGDEIVVWDTMTTYNGLIETTNTTAQEYLKVSSGNALPSQTVTLAQLAADTTNEYLGERVVIENVTIGVLGTNNTALTDADGNTINIYKAPTLNAEINENDVVTVTAIVSTYNAYQLFVNSADDVVEIQDGAATVIETVTIAEAKAGTAGEYYQVEGTVTYISGRNVYIQDATGGIVVYLTKDAATTQVGDKVKAYGALKLYNGLIELDAVDETNAQFYEILSSGNTVDAQEVTIEGLLADTTNEYLAEKITLNGVYVSYNSYNSSYGNVTYTLNDGNGNTIEIYRVTVASEAECFAPGSYVNVEAIVSSYNGYQLITTNDKIVVTGTCAHETTELVNEKDATLTAGGYTGDHECTVCGNYTERGTDTAPLTDVDSWGLVLHDAIDVKFKINMDSSIIGNAVVKITVGEKTYEYNAIDYTDAEHEYVYVSASVAAAQMTDEITVTVINGDDQAVKSGYTIKSYAETILSGDYNDTTKALVTAMLHYGAAAQTFFDYKTDALANAGLGSEESNVTIPDDAAGEIVVSGSAEGITFYGASLVFENKIAVRFYFTGSAEGIEGAVAKDDKFYIEVAGIYPPALDDAVSVMIGDMSVSYSPMNYIVRMAEKNENEDLVALVTALYNYHVAAKKLASGGE